MPRSPQRPACGGPLAKPGRDYIGFAGDIAAEEKMAAQFRPFNVVLPCGILLGCKVNIVDPEKPLF